MKIWIDAQLPPTLASWLTNNFDLNERKKIAENGSLSLSKLVTEQEDIKELDLMDRR